MVEQVSKYLPMVHKRSAAFIFIIEGGSQDKKMSQISKFLAFINFFSELQQALVDYKSN